MSEYVSRIDGKTYRVVTVHGESRSLFHVVDVNAPETDQPAIVASYYERWRAENHAKGVLITAAH